MVTVLPHAAFNKALLIASTDRVRDWSETFCFPYLDPSEIWKNGGWNLECFVRKPVEDLVRAGCTFSFFRSRTMTASSTAEKPGLFDTNFVSHLSSSQQISKLEAKRLETQWKKVCDHEKRSKERNKELLKDFERVEQHAALLAVKTERLKAYKQQYENYINKMYPRWKEELENHRFSELQNRNASTGSVHASGASLLTSSSPLRTAHLQPHFSGNTLLSSTPAHPPSSTMYNRPPPQTGYPVDQRHSYRQDPYSEFSYHDASRQRGSNLPPSGYLVSERRWQTPEYYDSHRHFDSRVHQGQFAANSREPENAYYKSPDHYSTLPGDPFYDRRPPHGEFPRNVPPDLRYMHPGTPHGQSQGTRPAAPYEPRTELQRTFLTHRNQPGPYDQNGQQARYHDGRQGSYRGYNDQRPDEFEPRRMEISIVNGRDEAQVDKPFMSGFPARPVSVSGQDTKQLPPEAYPSNQPFVPPEKPLERSIPVSDLPDPSFSSAVIETSLESGETHRDHGMKDAKSFTTPTTSEATPIAAVVKPAKENQVKQQSSPSEEITELSEKAQKLGAEPVKSVAIPQDGKQQSVGVKTVDGTNEKLKDKVAPTPKQTKKLDVEQSDEDDEESLDLSDLSLPDGNKEGLPFIPSQVEAIRHEDKREEATVFRGDSEVSVGTTNPVVVPDAAKSVTEDISEDIPESVALDDDEDLNDVPVRDEGKEILTNSGGQAAEQPKEGEINKDDEREKDVNEVLAKDEMETCLSKTEEERAPSVSVDGFLCLLQAVDADVEVSFSPETLYHSPRCSSDMREEIIRAAEVGDSLQSFDPNTVSMIVLEELPLLGSSSSSGCLIPDRVFSEGASCDTEKELRSFVESSLIKLWKALFSHLVNVVKNNVMSAEQVGNMFGSLLIAESSKHWKEGQLLLRRILEAAISDVSSHSASPPPSPKDHDLDLETRFETEAAYEQELDKMSIGSGGSSSTLGSTPPKVELNKSKEENRKATPDPTVSYEDDFEDEVPLTETAAYQKMMSSAHSEPDDDISDLLGTSGPQKQESEADDDVERELARTISPPVTSPRQRSPNHLKSAKQKPKLSLFETGTEVKNAEKDLGDSWGGSSLKSVKSDISDSESVVSPPLSPDFGVGYTPTALENSEQRNKLDKENDKSEPKSASDSKAKRKTDFWNTSDTESEVDLQLSTGGMDQDDDDFDFYG